MPNVSFKRKEYTELEPRWNLVRDVLSGSKAIKERTTDYLPRPNPTDTSNENLQRYAQYLQRAVFYAATGRTHKGFVGQVFARDPVATIPDAMKAIKTDADGAGNSLDQTSKKALGFVLAYGRAGIFADFPKREAAASLADVQAGKVRPILKLFNPWQIYNWRTETIGEKTRLSLVVLRDSDVINDDGFAQDIDEFYRVLRLRNGIYVYEIWYWDEKANDFVLDGAPVTPTDGAGKPWTEIPFQFIGAENNDPQPDLPPLYDMAEINIAHYRNSADYEESCYMVGQPTPVLTGLTETWVNEILKGQVFLGSRAAIPLPVGATAALLQATPNSMVFEALQHKERQLVALGAKLVEQTSVQRTATEASMEEASTTSVLATIAINTGKAITQGLTWCGKFINIVTSENEDSAEGDKIAYELNTDFDIATLPAAEVSGVIAAWQANAITDEEMRDKLKRGGWAYLEDEVWKDQIETANASMGLPMGSPTMDSPALRKRAADAAALADAQKQTE